jgi:hypothetical protein
MKRLPTNKYGKVLHTASILVDNRGSYYCIPRALEYAFETWVSIGQEYDGNGEFDAYRLGAN